MVNKFEIQPRLRLIFMTLPAGAGSGQKVAFQAGVRAEALVDPHRKHLRPAIKSIISFKTLSITLCTTRYQYNTGNSVSYQNTEFSITQIAILHQASNNSNKHT